MVDNFRWTMSISYDSNPNTMSYLPYSFLKDAYTKLGTSKLYNMKKAILILNTWDHTNESVLVCFPLFCIILSGLTFIFRKLLDSTMFQWKRGIA